MSSRTRRALWLPAALALERGDYGIVPPPFPRPARIFWQDHSVQALPATLANSFRMAPRIASLIERAPVTTARRPTSSRSASLAAKPRVSLIGCSGFAGCGPRRRFVFMIQL
jgi:hypothetical protein